MTTPPDPDTVARILQILIDEVIISEDRAPTISMETNFADDLDLESLEMAELALAVEDEFGISLDDEDIEQCATIGKLIAKVESKFDVPAVAV